MIKNQSQTNSKLTLQAKLNKQRGIAPLALLLIIAVVVVGGSAAAVKSSNKNKNADRALMGNNATSTSDSFATSTATSTGKTFNFDLEEQNNSGQSGKVVITEVDGKAKVIVNLTGKPSSVDQPSHIHLSSCATIGAVKYPLTNVSKGASQTMLPVSIDELLAGLPLSLNVHKSQAEIGVYVACGDISTSTVKDNKGNNGTTTATTSVKANASVKVKY